MKKLIFSFVILLVVAVAAWKYQSYFSLDKDLVSSVDQYVPDVLKSNDTIHITQYVPADTAVYVGGYLDKALVDFMAEAPVLALSASERASLYLMFQELIKKETPQARFFAYLWDDYTNNTDGSYQQMLEYFGLASEGEYAFYLHGAVPVLNLPVADASKIISLLKNATEASGLTYQSKHSGTTEVMSWSIAEMKAEIVVAVKENAVILTFASERDSEHVINQRLAQSNVEENFQLEERAIREQYGYTKDSVAMVNIERLLKGVLQTDESTLSMDIARYLPEQAVSQFKKAQSEMDSCKKDIINLASNAPRVVSGYKTMDITASTLNASAHGVWEIKNAVVIDALKQMQGYLPQHVLSNEERAVSVGLAFDMAQLAPSVTSLWKAFTASQFTCDELIQAQVKVKQMNPMMLGMVTGMTQGIKGIGASLFDAYFDPRVPQNTSLEMVVSIETTNPAGVMSLMTFIPELSDVSIPLDGTIVPLNLPLPIDLKLSAAVKGEHVVMFAGQKGKQVIDTMSNEPLTANALGMGSKFNYKKVAMLVEQANLLTLMQDNAELCMEGYSFLDQMKHLDMDLSYLNYVTDEGLSFKIDLEMAKPRSRTNANQIVGDWNTLILDETCQWVEIGQEHITETGLGSYVERDDGNQCDVYRSEYAWQQKGQKVVMSDKTFAQYRDNCSEDWQQEPSLETFYCELMNIEKDSFQCLYYGLEQEPFVYQYQRQ